MIPKVLHSLAIGQTMTDARWVTGDPFRQRDRALVNGCCSNNFSRAAMFPEMAHFELHDRFAGLRKIGNDPAR